MNKILKILKATKYTFVLVGMVLLLNACGSPPAQIEPITVTSPSVANESISEVGTPLAYPAPSDLDNAYPVPEPDLIDSGQPYPPPDPLAIATDGVRFSFDPSLKVGDTIVRGTAPPDLAIGIVDITYNGTILGVGRTDEQGDFAIPVAPLEAGRRLGIALGELKDGKTFEEMANSLLPYRGDGFMNVPNVGVYFETILLKE